MGLFFEKEIKSLRCFQKMESHGGEQDGLESEAIEI